MSRGYRLLWLGLLTGCGAAEAGDPQVAVSKQALVAEVVKVTRADRFQTYAGSWLYVEATTTAASGDFATNGYHGSGSGACIGVPANGAASTACPVLNVSFTENGVDYATGAQATLAALVDDGVYLTHRLLVRLSNAAGIATAPHPVKVKVVSDGGGEATRDVSNFVASVAPYSAGYQHDFFTRYQTGVDVLRAVDDVATQHPDITHILVPPFQTDGYRRAAMASLGCTVRAAVSGNAALPNSPGGSPAGFATPSICTTASAPTVVVLTSRDFGENNGAPLGNAITATFVNPNAANSPLSVAVSGKDITVSLSTNGTGSLTTTAAQLVAAVNANPSASALVSAATYRGNAGTGVVQPVAKTPLSDFLWAPAPGNPAVDTGFQVARVPGTFHILRVCKVCDGSKPGVLLTAGAHGREWVAPLAASEVMGRLVKNYGTDPETTTLVDNLDIFIVPDVNPDGTNYSMLQGGGSNQRKNLKNYCATASGGSTHLDPESRELWGADVSRNFSIGSIFDGYEGASADCTSQIYAGPFELSEPEAQNQLWLLQTFPNVRFALELASYGGHLTWSPGTYKTFGREPLPAATFGKEQEFWSIARSVTSRMGNTRGAALMPSQVGRTIDVDTTGAGNWLDEAFYHHQVYALTLTCGADRFSTTSTSNAGTSVGFQPTFSTEGRPEAQECADGVQGFLTSALAFAEDHTPPVTSSSTPSGTTSSAPITTRLLTNEPADIYYTTDGSTPTTGSTRYEGADPRSLDGAELTFSTTTTLSWIAADVAGNASAVQTATFVRGDSTSPKPPSCALTNVLAGPPKTLEITVQSAEFGLQSIEVTAATNATVDVPAFSSGETHPLVITATKLDQTQGSRVALTVTDIDGRVTDCDPVEPGEPSSPGVAEPRSIHASGGCSLVRFGQTPSSTSGVLALLAGLALLRRFTRRLKT